MESLRPQPSLKGFVAFAVSRFVEARGTTVADAAAYMIERWVDDNYDMLKDRYKIDVEAFAEYQKLMESVKKKSRGEAD